MNEGMMMNSEKSKVAFMAPQDMGHRDWGVEELLVLVPKKFS